MRNENSEFNSKLNINKPAGFLNSPFNEITIYTVIRILFKMKSNLGLEAMLQYMEKYQDTIEKNNPQLQETVSKAVLHLNVLQMYKEGIQSD
ncbi:MAG: hypothetical protein KJ864_01130 [Candidatus Omnitrophica bacterium]|nr:hypothetical protein [Candidatus Omnitrophota bacterium]